jgi:hypothetical protein
MLIGNPWKIDYAATAKVRLQAAAPQPNILGTSLKNGRLHASVRGNAS